MAGLVEAFDIVDWFLSVFISKLYIINLMYMFCRSLRKIVHYHFIIFNNKLVIFLYCLYSFYTIVKCIMQDKGGIGITCDLAPVFTKGQLIALHLFRAIV